MCSHPGIVFVFNSSSDPLLQNIINEKIYLFLWFWFMFLFTVSIFFVFYRWVSANTHRM